MNYLPLSDFDTMYFRRIVESGSISDTSNVITVIHLPPIINNTIQGGGIICENQTPAPLIQTELTIEGGTGSYTYLWQIRSGEDYIPAPAINDNHEYTPIPLSENTTFRRLVKSDDCISVSNEVEFEVRLNPGFMESPLSDTINSGDTILFHSIASGYEPITYQWIFNNEVIDNATEDDLVITNTHTNQTGYYYCIAENECGLAFSDTAYLLVTPGVFIKSTGMETEKPNIFPNPASKRIFIDHALNGENIITIYNISGTHIETLRNVSSIRLKDASGGINYIKIEYPEKSLVFYRTVLIF
jgi:hypothetical protein